MVLTFISPTIMALNIRIYSIFYNIGHGDGNERNGCRALLGSSFQKFKCDGTKNEPHKRCKRNKDLDWATAQSNFAVEICVAAFFRPRMSRDCRVYN